MAARNKSEDGAKAPEEAPKPKRAQRKKETVDLTRDDVIRKYLDVYQRCMLEDPKSFDAKGALNALDQISKILGLDTPIKAADIDGNRVILTLSEEVGDHGD